MVSATVNTKKVFFQIVKYLSVFTFRPSNILENLSYYIFLRFPVKKFLIFFFVTYVGIISSVIKAYACFFLQNALLPVFKLYWFGKRASIFIIHRISFLDFLRNCACTRSSLCSPAARTTHTYAIFYKK